MLTFLNVITCSKFTQFDRNLEVKSFLQSEVVSFAPKEIIATEKVGCLFWHVILK